LDVLAGRVGVPTSTGGVDQAATCIVEGGEQRVGLLSHGAGAVHQRLGQIRELLHPLGGDVIGLAPRLLEVAARPFLGVLLDPGRCPLRRFEHRLDARAEGTGSLAGAGLFRGWYPALIVAAASSPDHLRPIVRGHSAGEAEE
jgi:hypothetical protein